MIIVNKQTGLRERIGYKDLAERYLEFYGILMEDSFVVNLICMIDEWEIKEDVKFERLMPSDWEMILKAVKFLNIEPIVVNN